MEILLIPILTGAFGWLLIWLFAKSLFFPTKAIQIGSFTWASKLTPLIQQFPIDLIIPNSDNNDANFKDMQPLIEEKLDFFFNHTIKEKLPMMSMFIGEKTVAQLKKVFLEELAMIFPQIIEQFAQNAKKEFSNTTNTKWSKTLAPIVMKAIVPVQWAAFILGCTWGALMVFILNWF
jgi:hypothetical protein